jgi:S-adenosylmethionine:tRNA ribosyltransferase-isomerase
VVEDREGGIRVLKFADESRLPSLGEIPLPPYIHTSLSDPDRYQTVYSRAEGSVAAPTAGLHFTHELLEQLRLKGVRLAFVTLHVGMDTFRPVRTEDPSEHPIHREYGTMTAEAARELSAARTEGRRVVCVGTTSMRLVEAAAQVGHLPGASPFAGWVNLFIVPGYQFKVADAMITNFHLPKTTLLMLVSAFAGRESVLDAYRQAMTERYRFYSFGDAMLIV